MTEASHPDLLEIHETVGRYYAERLKQFGTTARGVDWSSAESQALRFSRLLSIVDGGTTAGTLIDFGCGYGALYDHLQAAGSPLGYCGFDVSGEMIAAASALHAGAAGCAFTSQASALSPATYAVASGIFNVKLAYSVDRWRAYVMRTIETLDALGTRGFAFNMLSTYSEADRRRGDLFYADPGEFFDLCKRRFSPRVALLHDYPLYEFTMIVRK
jgi:SAM-dependent methyltransferase